MDPDEQQRQMQIELARENKLSVEKLKTLTDASHGKAEFHELAYLQARKENEVLRKKNETLEETTIQERKEKEKERKEKEKERKEKEIERKKNELLRKKNETLEEERETNSDILAGSIEHIYCRKDQPRFPELELNTSVEPSIEGHHLKGMLPQKASYAEEISGSEVWKQLNEVVIPISIDKVNGRRPHRIRSHFDPEVFPLTYQNEIAIQFNVRDLVRDVIACMGCKQTLESHMEISFYGITPDIIVVFEGQRMIFVIEVKAPNREGKQDNVFQSDLVAGQIWLYLMAMKQAGVENPLGAICTFNQIRIVSLTEMGAHCFDKALGNLKKLVATPWEVAQHDDSKEKPSPDPKRQRASEKSKKFDFNHPAESFDTQISPGVKVFKAKLYGGEIVDTDRVLPMLLLALKTAFMETEGQVGPDQKLTEVRVGDDLSSRLFAFATKTALRFARTKKDFRVIERFPGHMSENFFLLDSIGAGHQGQVSLVVNTSGAPAAVKFYHLKPSRAATGEQRSSENEAGREAVEKKRDEELARWNISYPGEARAITLGGLPCLLMPYGTRIPQSEREQALSFVKSELQRFCSYGYAYQARDLRWRHVLQKLDGNLFLADLGSLEELGKKDYSTVKKHIDYLKEKINQDSGHGVSNPSAGQGVFTRGSGKKGRSGTKRALNSATRQGDNTNKRSSSGRSISVPPKKKKKTE